LKDRCRSDAVLGSLERHAIPADARTAKDMEAGARIFAAMDPSETPGSPAPVDMCEVKIYLEAPSS